MTWSTSRRQPICRTCGAVPRRHLRYRDTSVRRTFLRAQETVVGNMRRRSCSAASRSSMPRRRSGGRQSWCGAPGPASCSTRRASGWRRAAPGRRLTSSAPSSSSSGPREVVSRHRRGPPRHGPPRPRNDDGAIQVPRSLHNDELRPRTPPCGRSSPSAARSQKHGPVTLSGLGLGVSPTAADELESIYSRRHPYITRTWIKSLALSYSYTRTRSGSRPWWRSTESLARAAEAKEGSDSADAFGASGTRSCSSCTPRVRTLMFREQDVGAVGFPKVVSAREPAAEWDGSTLLCS